MNEKHDLILPIIAAALVGIGWGLSSRIYPELPYAFGIAATAVVFIGILWFFLRGPGRRPR